MSLQTVLRLEGEGTTAWESPLLGYAYDLFEQICAEVNSQNLHEFGVAANDLDVDDEDALLAKGVSEDEVEDVLEQQMNETGPFFDADDVLTAVEAMTAYFQTHTGEHILDSRHSAPAETLISDLDALAGELQNASEQRKRVRFEIW